MTGFAKRSALASWVELVHRSWMVSLGFSWFTIVTKPRKSHKIYQILSYSHAHPIIKNQLIAHRNHHIIYIYLYNMPYIMIYTMASMLVSHPPSPWNSGYVWKSSFVRAAWAWNARKPLSRRWSVPNTPRPQCRRRDMERRPRWWWCHGREVGANNSKFNMVYYGFMICLLWFIIVYYDVYCGLL